MPSRPNVPGNVPLPSPYPEGWYLVASRQQILKDQLVRKTWMGEDIVVWCDENGSICVAEAFCPHLGADLGPDAGGRVCGGRLVCPFHGYEFDATGQCVATPYAEPPKAARLRTFETHEVLDLVFAWWGIEGREPQWRLPADGPAQSGWSKLVTNTVRFPGHPQETTENSVDLGHLRYVHGYDSVERIGRASVDGPRLESRFDFRRARKIGGIATLTFNVSANTVVYGLGYSYVEIRERSIGMDLRLWVLATPVDGALVDLSLVSQVREIRRPKRWIAGLGFLPVKLRAPIMNRIIAAFQLQDVHQDVVIWGRKRYRARPLLCRSDGEIIRYRRYCAQFYPDTADSATGSLLAFTPLPRRVLRMNLAGFASLQLPGQALKARGRPPSYGLFSTLLEDDSSLIEDSVPLPRAGPADVRLGGSDTARLDDLGQVVVGYVSGRKGVT